MKYAEQPGFILLLITIVLTSGCAWTDAQMNLVYSPEPTKKNPFATVAPMQVELRVDDERPHNERTAVGNKRNGFGMVTATITSSKEPTTIVHDALTTEFLNSGHKISSSPADSADIAILVALKRYWGDVSIHFWDLEFIGTLDANVTIRDPQSTSVLLAKPLSSAFRESRQIGTDSAYESVLNGVLSEFVRGFSRDPLILRALGRKELDE